MTNRQYSRLYVKRKKAYENRFTPIMYKAIRREKANIIAVAKKTGPLTALTQVNLMTGEHFRAALTLLYKTISPKEAKRVYRELSKTKDVKAGFGVSIDFLADIIDFLNNNILDKVVRELTATTMERVYRAIINGNANGDSYDEIIRKLEDTELDRKRARMIARTESNRAVNAGHDLGRKAYPYKVDKVWLAAKDKRTRGNPSPEGADDTADHYHMDGVVVQEEEAFTDPRNNAQLMYPGDSTLGAPAASVINCRCNIRFIPLRDANGRLIMKPDRVLPRFGGVGLPVMPNIPVMPVRPGFVPARDNEEFLLRIRNHVDGDVKLTGDLSFKNSILKSLYDNKIGDALPKIKGIAERKMKEGVVMNYATGDKVITVNKLYNNTDGITELSTESKRFEQSIKDRLLTEQDPRIRKELSKYLQYERLTVGDVESIAYDVFTHELGHHLDYSVLRKNELRNTVRAQFVDGFKDKSKKISSYASTNDDEYIAESFAAYKKGLPIDPDLAKYFKSLNL